MSDTTKMRAAVQDENYKNVWLNGSTHYEGCEYSHYPCAVLRLCDELDKAHDAIRYALSSLEYMRMLWGGEGVTDGIATRLREALEVEP